jgi:hypothetical protein
VQQDRQKGHDRKYQHDTTDPSQECLAVNRLIRVMASSISSRLVA